jgi:hypothetical protein
MKEVVLALMLGTAFCYELVVFIKARGYVRVLYKTKHSEEDDKAVKFGLGCFSLIYVVFLILGMAISELWYVYLFIFALSIIQSPINKYLKRRKYWESMVQFKRLDSALSMATIAFLFFAHFHPEVLTWIW